MANQDQPNLGIGGPNHAIIPMTPELQETVNAYRWRVQQARILLSDPAMFHAVYGALGEHELLTRRALEAYIREQEDD